MDDYDSSDVDGELKQTFQIWIQNLWEKLEPAYPVTNPQFWITLWERTEHHFTHILDDNGPLEILRKVILTFLRCWNKNSAKWSVTSFDQLYDKTSRLLGGTYQTLLPMKDLKNVEDSVDGLLEMDPITPEDFTSGLTKELTSTSSTIAPTQMDHVDAGGKKKRSFKDAFENLCGNQNSSDPSIQSIGTTFSYISKCVNGIADRKFGLEESYKDYRVCLKVYDGNECAKNKEKWYRGKERELDITINQMDPLMKKVDVLFSDTLRELQKRGASLKISQKKSNPYWRN